MEERKINHWPFQGYLYEKGDVLIEDVEEELTFIKQKNDDGTSDLILMVEKELHPHIRSPPIIPNLSEGYVLLEEMSESEWKKLSKEYFVNKLRGEKIFREWIKEKLYNPLNQDLYETSWVAESMPYPGAPKEHWERFNRAYKEEFEKE